MSAKRSDKYKNTSRAKGAAIAWMHSPAAAALRERRRHRLGVRMVLIVVALIEAFMMLGVSTYSWIESTSSLVIRGDNMPITKNRAYQMTTADSGDSIDFHNYFSSTSFYQFAKASSSDGEHMFFPMYSVNTLTDAVAATSENYTKPFAGAYRKGDTTDFNTSYYCFDIELKNTQSTTTNYYFAPNSRLFNVTGSDNAHVCEVAAQCYRLSIQQGSGTALIYSNTESNVTYYAANSTSVTNGTSVTSHALTDYTYKKGDTSKTEVCSAPANGTSKITVRIWFELNAPIYKTLTQEEKKLLYDTKVNVDLELINAASDVRSYFFDDYSGATFADATKESFGESDNRIYFSYSENNVRKHIRLIPYEYSSQHVLWRTANSDDNIADVLSLPMRQYLNSNYSNAYFYYGTLSNATVDGNLLVGGNEAVRKKWTITQPVTSNGDTATGQEEGGTYTFNAYGVTDSTNYDPVGCFGRWQGGGNNNTPTMIYFDDKMVQSKNVDYNIDADDNRTVSPIETAAENTRMFVSIGSTVSSDNAKNTVRMQYDETVGMYRAYLPHDSIESDDTVYFYYLTSDYNSTYRMQFTAMGRADDQHHIFTALGYNGNGAFPTSNGNTGYGTWDDVDLITFSGELADHDIDAAYRYKITYTDPHLNTTFTYYLAGTEDHMGAYAYLPHSVANAGFYRYNGYNAASPDATWTSAARNGSTTFYPIETVAASGQTNPRGYWNITVLVDGTRDNLIKTIMQENPSASLQYTLNGTDYTDLLKIDNYRWCTTALTDEEAVTYRFIAYTGDEVDANNESLGYTRAEFSFTHQRADGIYYTITEAAQPQAQQPESEP